MVKVVDFKKIVLVATIFFVLGTGFLVERLIFFNQTARAVLFRYSKEIISFNLPILSDGSANEVFKIENLIRFSYPLFAATSVQEIEDSPTYEDDAIVIDYNQDVQKAQKMARLKVRMSTLNFRNTSKTALKKVNFTT